MRRHTMVPSTFVYGNHAFASEILTNLWIQFLMSKWVQPSWVLVSAALVYQYQGLESTSKILRPFVV
jgi:hypothetical protein